MRWGIILAKDLTIGLSGGGLKADECSPSDRPGEGAAMGAEDTAGSSSTLPRLLMELGPEPESKWLPQ